MTASDLKYNIEIGDDSPHYFTRSSMKFFGDTMKNYGVRSEIINIRREDNVEVWELYRKRPVKHGLKNSAYFRKDNFKKVSER